MRWLRRKWREWRQARRKREQLVLVLSGGPYRTAMMNPSITHGENGWCMQCRLVDDKCTIGEWLINDRWYCTRCADECFMNPGGVDYIE